VNLLQALEANKTKRVRHFPSLDNGWWDVGQLIEAAKTGKCVNGAPITKELRIDGWQADDPLRVLYQAVLADNKTGGPFDDIELVKLVYPNAIRIIKYVEERK